MFIIFIIPKIMSWGAINLHYCYDLSLFGLSKNSFTVSLKNIIVSPQFYRDYRNFEVSELLLSAWLNASKTIKMNL